MKSVYPLGLFLLTLIYSVFTQCEGLTCRNCQDIFSPNDCRGNMMCGQVELFPVVLVWWMLIGSTATQNQGMTCRVCNDMQSPRDCRNALVCDQGQICYTRQISDHLGRTVFSMGCEDKNTCELITNTPFGKRDRSVDNPANPDTCLECCPSDSCNAGLCQGSVGNYSFVTTNIPVSANTGCPEKFVSFKEHCYRLTTQRAHWHAARIYCQSQGADLVILRSQEQHEFLREQMILLNATYTIVFWLGGFYSHASGEWEWLDGSPFSYAPWSPGQPPSQGSYSDKYDFYAAISNPPNEISWSSYQKAFIVYEMSGSYNMGVLCQRRCL